MTCNVPFSEKAVATLRLAQKLYYSSCILVQAPREAERRRRVWRLSDESY